MATEENMAVVRRIFEGINNRTFAHRQEHQGSPFSTHFAGGPESDTPIDGAVRRMEALLTAFPDYHITIEDMIANEDKVATRGHWTGTHQGEFQGIAPTGRTVTVNSMNVFHFKDGKITERWAMSDQLGLLQQLGAAPTSEQGNK